MSRWYSGETQICWACKELIKGREISHRDEIASVNGWRLAAIIHSLIHRYNWPIIATRKGLERVAYYRLEKGVNTDELSKPRSFFKEKGDVGASPGKKKI